MRKLALLLLLIPGFAEATPAQTETEGHSVIAEYFPQYNGVMVQEIELTGLVRSREGLVRWMLGCKEGVPFDADSWRSGIERLYKTEALYGIRSQITREAIDGHPVLKIKVFIDDKWTLFPYFDFQGGGDSFSFSAGVFDSNLLGTFTNAYFGGGYLDKLWSYELGISQKWFLQTTYSLGILLARKTQPINLQNPTGETYENFSWQRTQQQVILGKQNGEHTYWDIRLDFYKDAVRSPKPRTENFAFQNLQQYQLSPSLRLGKIVHSDYLEQGSEFALHLSDANLFDSSRDYHSVRLAWKQVFFLPDTRNIAYYISLAHMSSAPLAYQFRLGGLDSVRGFSLNRAIAYDTARTNLEYRSTLWTDRFELFDIGRVVFQGCLFADLGAAWNAVSLGPADGKVTQRGTRVLSSAGIGARAIFLHFSNAILRLDLAKPIFPKEGYDISFGVGQFF